MLLASLFLVALVALVLLNAALAIRLASKRACSASQWLASSAWTVLPGITRRATMAALCSS